MFVFCPVWHVTIVYLDQIGELRLYLSTKKIRYPWSLLTGVIILSIWAESNNPNPNRNFWWISLIKICIVWGRQYNDPCLSTRMMRKDFLIGSICYPLVMRLDTPPLVPGWLADADGEKKVMVQKSGEKTTWECNKNPVNNGIDYQPTYQLVSRTSEPSTGSKDV